MNLNYEILNNLRSKYGDAFYLLDSEQFEKNFHELKNAFSSIYENFNIAYSYKTNYTPKFCKIINSLGGYAEVVSEMELELALKVGVNPKNIIWNGPVKNEMVLRSFLFSGGTVNLDGLEELNFVKAFILDSPSREFNLGIRCNFDVHDSCISRFGFDIDSKAFNEVLEFCINTDNVNLINLQCHFAKRSIKYWPDRAKGMLEIVDRIGIVPKRIDLGGGLFGKMDDSLRCQFHENIPNYAEYAESVASLFVEHFKNNTIKPELVIEPGSALVGDCMKFIGTVKGIKNVRGKNFATLLGSQKNISMTGVNPPLVVYSNNKNVEFYDDIDLVGFTCIEGDVLYHSYKGYLGVDDIVVISNCGSYSLVMKPPFILPNFPVLDISNNEVEVIKKKETFDDIFHTFNF